MIAVIVLVLGVSPSSDSEKALRAPSLLPVEGSSQGNVVVKRMQQLQLYKGAQTRLQLYVLSYLSYWK